MENKRAHPRYAVEIDAEFADGSATIPARTRDISHGGMACYARQALPIGRVFPVSLSLVFKEGTLSEPLAVRAKVVWCTPLRDGFHQIGTTFIGISADTLTYLEMFLRYLQDGLDHQAEEDDRQRKTTSSDDDDRFG